MSIGAVKEASPGIFADSTLETQPNMIHLTNLNTGRRETTVAGNANVDEVAVGGDEVSVGDPDFEIDHI